MEIKENFLFEFRINYGTKEGDIYLYSKDDNSDSWLSKLKLTKNEGDIWKGQLRFPKGIEFPYKFVFINNRKELRWEGGFNRFFSSNPENLTHLQKENNAYIINCKWDFYEIIFNVHYNNKSDNVNIIGDQYFLDNWDIKNNKEKRKLNWDSEKKIIDKNGKEVKGFFTITFNIKSEDPIKEELDIQYKYLVNDQYEEGQNRHIHFLLNLEDEENKFCYLTNPEEYKLMVNNRIEIFDYNIIIKK